MGLVLYSQTVDLEGFLKTFRDVCPIHRQDTSVDVVVPVGARSSLEDPIYVFNALPFAQD